MPIQPVEVESSTLDLQLRTPFRVSHGASSVRENVLVRIGDGLGEAAIVPYYPFGRPEVMEYLDRLDIDELIDWHDGSFSIIDSVSKLPDGPAPARAAADMALHDLWGQSLGHPLYRLWGLDARRCPDSSVTIGIPETDDQLIEQLHGWDGWPIIKLKLGTGDLKRDEEIVRVAMEHTKANLCVDANAAWSVPEASEIIPNISSERMIFIEQPLRVEDPADWIRLRAMLPNDAPPLVADESIQSIHDIIRLADSIDGINLKLAKSGGIVGARRMIEVARALDLKVLLGCMVESSVAVTAAAHLSPMVDWVDLDGPVLVKNDPYDGFVLDAGRVSLPSGPGLGLTERTAL